MEQESRDLSEMLQAIERAQVVAIIFPMFNQCLVLDARQSAEEPPTLSVSPPLGSAERRLRQLNQLRPQLPPAKEMIGFPWPGTVESMVHSGIWERIVSRMVNSGFKSAASSCQEALETLRGWERKALATMIRGEGPYHTIWSRAPRRER